MYQHRPIILACLSNGRPHFTFVYILSFFDCLVNDSDEFRSGKPLHFGNIPQYKPKLFHKFTKTLQMPVF